MDEGCESDRAQRRVLGSAQREETGHDRTGILELMHACMRGPARIFMSQNESARTVQKKILENQTLDSREAMKR